MKENASMSRWSQATERNRAAVAKNAERILADTTYDRLRSRPGLIAMVATYVVTTVAMPVFWLAAGTLAGVVSTAAWFVVYLFLRVAVRSQADLPDDVLDERMRSERDSVYVGAFRLVSTVVFLAANAAFLAVAFGDENDSITFDYEAVSAIYWALLSLLLGAPSLILALRMRSTDGG